MMEIGDGLAPEDVGSRRSSDRPGARKYPVDRLEPGQHLVVALDTHDAKARDRARSALCQAAIRYRKRHAPERRFTTRYSADENALYLFRLEDDA